jgi:hypothetical protein
MVKYALLRLARRRHSVSLASGVHNMECGGEVVVQVCRVANPAIMQSGFASLPYALIQSNTPYAVSAPQIGVDG